MEMEKEPNKPNQPPGEEISSLYSDNELLPLNEAELENVSGGMQNQLNDNPTAEHPGGANTKSNSNPAKVSILCNLHDK